MKKPNCKLVGMDVNVFSIIERVKKSLKLAKCEKQTEEFAKKAFKCKSYSDVFILASEYVNIC